MEVLTTTALMLMRIEVGVFTGLNCFAFKLIGTILYSISVINLLLLNLGAGSINRVCSALF